MPGTTAFTGPGYQWKVDIGLTGNFVVMAYSRDIKGPTISRQMADISNNTSTTGKEYKPSLIDSGTISTTIVYNPGDPSTKNILAALQQGVPANFQVFDNPPNNTLYWSGFGYFSKFQPDSPYSSTAQTAAVELTVSGGVVQN